MAKGPLYPDQFGDAQLKQTLDALGASYTTSTFDDGHPVYYIAIPDSFEPTATKDRRFFAYTYDCENAATAANCAGMHFSFHDPLGSPSLSVANEFNIKHYDAHVVIDPEGAGVESDHIAMDGISQGNATIAVSSFIQMAIEYLKSREGGVASVAPPSLPGLSGLIGLKSAFAGSPAASAPTIPAGEAAYIESVRAAHRR